MPELLIYADKLRDNFNIICEKLRDADTSAAFVTKLAAGNSDVLRTLYDAGCRYFAESRIDNFKNYPTEMATDPTVKKLLICLPYPSIAEDVVKYSTCSLNSELDTLVALDSASRALREQRPDKPKHQIILMVEGGDRREGVLPENVPALVEKIVNELHDLEFIGIGSNFNCLGGIISDVTKMHELSALAEELRACGLPCPVVSGGNSGTWHMIDDRTLPGGITEVRLGEIMHNGRETSRGESLTYLHQDVYHLTAPIIELSVKPSQSQGERFYNVNGELGSFTEDRGDIKRMLVACGGQDFGSGTITPLDHRLKYLGHSGDHTLIEIIEGDLTDFAIGDIIHFQLDYSGTNHCFISPQVKKKLV